MVALRRRVPALPTVAGDTLLSLAAGLFSMVHLLTIGRGPGDHGPTERAVVLSVLCASALLLRSRWPIGTLVTIGVLGSVYGATSDGPLAILPAVVVSLYTATASDRPRLEVWSAAIAMVVTLNGIDLTREIKEGHGLGTGVLLDTGWMAMALMFGESMHNRHAYAQEAELRAVQAERIQQEEAQRRVVEERLQIARELHDILAHTVALINVQAGVAAHVIDQRPDQAREALNHIKEASRTTLQELRALVGVLREPDGPAPRAPAAGLDALDDLVASVRDAGLAVELDVQGRNGPLPATVDVAAYRILQESLTNVLKHAGPVPVRVSVHQDGGLLKLFVANRAGAHVPVTRGEGSGHGIDGMRERAVALGGSLDAGPLPGGGFRVEATLPVPGSVAHAQARSQSA